MRLYGTMLLDGNVIPADENEAFRYFKKSADDDDHNTIIQCGKMLYNGVGTEID